MMSTMDEHTEDQEKINLLDEEATLRIYGDKLSIPNLVQSNKMYLLLTGFTELDIKDQMKANYTSLNWIMDLKDSIVYLDFGYNRQRLTRSLLNKLSDSK